MTPFGPPLGVSSLALACTGHLALALLLNHRQARGRILSPLTLVSMLGAGLPWVLPSLPGLAAGFLAHAGWFAFCEQRSRRRLDVVPATARVAALPRPSPPGPRPLGAAGQRPKGFVQAPVLAVFDETPDVRTFRLARPEGFAFKAGQFLTVRLRADAREVVRCYSISSPPAAAGYLEISVKRQGLVSSALHAVLRPGSVLSVRAPAGRFVYPDDDDRPLLLLAGGIGITPLLSMLRHAVLTEPTRPVTLLYSARREGDFAFHDELVAIARRNPQVRVCLAASREASRPDVYPGRIDAPLLSATVPNLADAIALLCGPSSMIAELTQVLHRLGTPPAQVRSELFEAAVAASGRLPEAEVAAGEAGAPPGQTYRLRATRCGREVAIAAGQTLLEAAEANGLDIPSLCRAGVCGTCRTRVVEGVVDCPSEVLDAEDRAAGYVLACVASARGHCAIEA
jgi:ferredoxin-NADP reductase